MSTTIEQFQVLLQSMTNAFLDELPERCQRIEQRLLALEQAPGGTHGLNIVTSICHQFENQLTEARSQQCFDSVFTSRALAHVDLLNRVQGYALAGSDDCAELETELDTLRQATLRNCKAGLITESSPLMVNLYEKALAPLPLRLTVADDGLKALGLLLHEPFDFVIVERELKELNGIALMLALRAAQARNQKIAALLVSSNQADIPEAEGFEVVLLRNRNLSKNLQEEVQNLLR